MSVHQWVQAMELMQLELAHKAAYLDDQSSCHQPQSNSGRIRAVPKVLVLDEDADTADTLAMLFEMFGCQVRATYDWKDVERIAAEFHPDLMIIELGRPQACVLETIRCIRVAAGTQTLRVAAHSAWTHEKARAWAWEVGCDDFLLKPVEASVLRQLLEDLPIAEMDSCPVYTSHPLAKMMPDR
jgi:CheY-like chemotaxis protein